MDQYLHFFELWSVLNAADRTDGGVAPKLGGTKWGEVIGLGGLPGEAGEFGSLSRKLPLMLSILQRKKKEYFKHCYNNNDHLYTYKTLKYTAVKKR